MQKKKTGCELSHPNPLESLLILNVSQCEGSWTVILRSRGTKYLLAMSISLLFCSAHICQGDALSTSGSSSRTTHTGSTQNRRLNKERCFKESSVALAGYSAFNMDLIYIKDDSRGYLCIENINTGIKTQLQQPEPEPRTRKKKDKTNCMNCFNSNCPLAEYF